jgi:hypothetical protein
LIYFIKVRIVVPKYKFSNKMTFFAQEGISIRIYVGFIIMLNENLSQKFHSYSIFST